MSRRRGRGGFGRITHSYKVPRGSGRYHAFSLVLLEDFCVVFLAVFIVLSFQRGFNAGPVFACSARISPAAKPHCVGTDDSSNEPTGGPPSNCRTRQPSRCVPSQRSYEPRQRFFTWALRQRMLKGKVSH